MFLGVQMDLFDFTRDQTENNQQPTHFRPRVKILDTSINPEQYSVCECRFVTNTSIYTPRVHANWA